MKENANLVVTRESAIPNGVRDYRLVLDGKEVGRLSNGSSITLPVSSGPHSLIAKIDWASSYALSFDLDPGAVLAIRIKTTLDPFQLLRAGIGLPSSHLSLSIQEALSGASESAPERRPLRLRKPLIWLFGSIFLGILATLAVTASGMPSHRVRWFAQLFGGISAFVGFIGAAVILLRSSSGRD